jgi:hypothetical protein
MPAVIHSVEAEKEEVNWLLTSGALGRSNHLARMLAFICEKHFEGESEQVKEYTIAVEALGRRSDFDPQVDTIVRVTAHSLRKRLQEIYLNGGADHRVHLVIPAGHYVPSFVHRESDPRREGLDVPPAMEAGAEVPVARVDVLPPPESAKSVARGGGWMPAVVLVVAVGALAVLMVSHRKDWKSLAGLGRSAAALPAPASTIRALMGAGRKPYVDRSGNTWTSGRYCTGGEDVSLPAQPIGGTEDPYLYLAGVRGITHCSFPVKPGMYEIHFDFAETSNLQPATRRASLTINATETPVNFDVVDNAGGRGMATAYVAGGVQPENDGSIHVDYTSEVSPLNAVEILPATSEKLLPVRLITGPAAIVDSKGQVWLSDRYFNGGRRGQLPDQAMSPNRGIYSYDRIGRFRYNIPVLPNQKYRVTLYFSEPWFGKYNSTPGGVGSRVFDVSANGSPLLKNFDIMAEGGSNPVVKTFDNLEGTPQGSLEISFLPLVNYPLVNAIEVEPEP